MSDAFTDDVLKRLPAAGRRHLPAAALAAQLEALTFAAKQAWPKLQVPAGSWAGFLAPRLEPARDVAAVAKLDGPGLYLACACLKSDPAALAALDAELERVGRPALRKLGLADAAADEALQRARDHLLVPAGGPPRLDRFTGRGTLRAWLRTVLVHLAQSMVREHRPGAGSEEDLLALPGVADPELDAMRAEARAEFGHAFREAIAALDPRHRSLLRLHVVERLSIDRLAPLYGSSRASAARWLTEARAALARGVRERMTARLELGTGELDSLMNLVRSRLDVSLARVLKEAGA